MTVLLTNAVAAPVAPIERDPVEDALAGANFESVLLGMGLGGVAAHASAAAGEGSAAAPHLIANGLAGGSGHLPGQLSSDLGAMNPVHVAPAGLKLPARSPVADLAAEARGRELLSAAMRPLAGVSAGPRPVDAPAEPVRSPLAHINTAEVHRAADVVARAVQHSGARQAFMQVHRSNVDLPMALLSSEAETASQNGWTPTNAVPETAPGSGHTPSNTGHAAAAIPMAVAGDSGAVGFAVDGGVPTGLDPMLATARPVSSGATAVSPEAPTLALAGAPADAQIGQIAVPDMDRIDLRFADGEHVLRLTVARELDGLNVEVKAPRELVADLRLLEPEVKAGFLEDGLELASYDAQPDGESADGDGDGDDIDRGPQPWSTAGPTADESARATASPLGQGHLLSRMA